MALEKFWCRNMTRILAVSCLIILLLAPATELQAESALDGKDTDSSNTTDSAHVMDTSATHTDSGGIHSAEEEGLATQHLLELLAPMKTFTAEFSQTVLGARSEVLQASEGRIAIERPAHFRWELTQPYPQLIVSRGDLLYLYDPDLEQVQIEFTESSLSGTPALLLSGTASQIAESFRVEEPPEGVVAAIGASAPGRVFVLYPLDESSLYDRMTLTFQNAAPASFHIIDSLGQRTDVSFYNISVNQDLDAGLFEFKVPVGVDITGHAADRALHSN